MAVFFRVRPPKRDSLSAQARDMLRFSSLAERHCKSASEVAARILSRSELHDASPAKLRRRSPERFRYSPKPVIPRNSGIGANALRQTPLSTSFRQKTAVAISAALAMLPHMGTSIYPDFALTAKRNSQWYRAIEDQDFRKLRVFRGSHIAQMSVHGNLYFPCFPSCQATAFPSCQATAFPSCQATAFSMRQGY